jgi:hypothetical protein
MHWKFFSISKTPYFFFFNQKESWGNPQPYPKYIKHKIKEYKLGGHQPNPVNRFAAIKDKTNNTSYKLVIDPTLTGNNQNKH